MDGKEFIFIYVLFNQADSITDYVLSNGGIISK
jgi:hypothetical protein